MIDYKKEEKYSMQDFIYYMEKYNDDLFDKKWTKAEIATNIAKAMMDFFPDTDVPY